MAVALWLPALRHGYTRNAVSSAAKEGVPPPPPSLQYFSFLFVDCWLKILSALVSCDWQVVLPFAEALAPLVTAS
jgi:hypothetical protein